jgi:hypothetical protein
MIKTKEGIIDMKMYVWTPNGHGQLSFFVVAENTEEAYNEVCKKVENIKGTRFGDYECDGWGTDYYDLEEVKPMQVYTHVNE